MPGAAALVDAVFAFGREVFGDEVERAVVLPGGSHLKVHLEPLPVVARVASFGGAGKQEQWRETWQRELDVAAHLRTAGVPATAPTELADPGPYRVDSAWVSLWEFVEIDRARTITAADSCRPRPTQRGKRCSNVLASNDAASASAG